MTPDQALELLGLDADTTWVEIRARYRDRIRRTHPDLTGPGDESHRAAAGLNEAFTVLERIYRRGLAPPPRAATARAAREPASAPGATPAEPAEPAVGVELVDDDSLAIVAPADEVFLRLHAALDRLGDVVYADPDGGFLEALVRLPGTGTGQLTVSLQGRAHATEAFFTLDGVDTRPPPVIDDVVRAVARLVRAGVA